MDSIILTNVDAMWNQRCINIVLTLFRRCLNVVSTSGTGVENSTSDFVSFSTSDQRYFNVDPQRWNNVDPTLKCWQSFLQFTFIVCQSWGLSKYIKTKLQTTSSWELFLFSRYLSFCHGFLVMLKKRLNFRILDVTT